MLHNTEISVKSRGAENAGHGRKSVAFTAAATAVSGVDENAKNWRQKSTAVNRY